MNNPYLNPMKPWPSLAKYAKEIAIVEEKVHFHVYEGGDPNSPGMLLIHGLGDEADSWRHIFEPLTETHHVIAPDLSGFGRSPGKEWMFNFPSMAANLVELMEAAGLREAVLVGNSLGAMLAHWIAIEYPGKVSKLILLGGSLYMKRTPIDLGVVLAQIPGVGERLLYTRYRNNPDKAYASLRSYYHKLDNLPKEDRDFLFQRVNERVWSESQKEAYFFVLRKLSRWLPQNQGLIKKELEFLKVPTLIVRGESDQLFSGENFGALEKVQSPVDAVILEECGHLPQQEQPEELLSIIKDFI